MADKNIPDFSRLSFKEAFAAARSAPNDTRKFSWNGKTYTTDVAADVPKTKTTTPDESAAETQRLRRQNDAAGPSATSRPAKEFKLPDVTYTDEMNEALLMGASGAGLARRLGKELTRAGELHSAAKLREGTKALKDASESAKKVRNYTKDTEPVLGFKKGGVTGKASKRGDGIAQRGKTKGRMV